MEKDIFKEIFREKTKARPVLTNRDEDLWNRIEAEINPAEKSFKLSPYWYAAAASVILCMSTFLAVYFLDNKHNQISGNDSVITTDNQTAGSYEKNIQDELNNSETVINIEKIPSENLEKDSWNHFTAGNSITEKTLQDGSVITLNKEAEVQVAESFKKDRRVKLSGEAYFEIQPDKTRPFIVYFSDYKLEVLGTKFNICPTGDQSMEIIVSEGLVRVYDNVAKYGIELTKGNKLELIKGKKSILSEVDADNYIAWKTGKLFFRGNDLNEVVKILSRNYNTEILLPSQLNSCKFTGDLSELNLEEALQVISLTNSVKVEKSKGKIYLQGPGCD
ncbi:MAG: FecR family protein [Cytophagaceae bacterium]